MPSDVSALESAAKAASSADLAGAIAALDCAGASATVIGYGNMGRHHVKALQALGVSRIHVCSRSPGPLEELRGLPGVECSAGGFERLACHPQPDAIGIVATPAPLLAAASQKLAAMGCRRLLIEKPVALESLRIRQLANELDRQGVEAFCGYNRAAYPAVCELRARCEAAGGLTSCGYTFTEMIKPDWPQRFPAEELARWGIANSLHVISMAHALIGPPATWSAYRRGRLPWHPSGAVFVGSGISRRGIPFAYHADWGSAGRWSVEANSNGLSYRLCPLEKLYQKGSPLAEWEEVPLAVFDAGVKAGFVEQIAALLDPRIRELAPLVSLREAASLTRYAEEVFGYAPSA